MILGGPLFANRNELRDALAHNLGAAPGTTAPGMFYYDTGLFTIRFWNGAAWINVDPSKAANASIQNAALATNPLDRANHGGSQLASTISNLQATVTGYSLSLFAVPTAALDHGGQRASNVGDPTSPQDAATRSWTLTQVEQSAAGISSKPPVRAVATANVASLSGSQTIDGVTLVAGDRVLLTGQTTAAQNGPWVVASGAWTRPPAGADNDELTPGALWLVLAGTANAGTQWRLATTGTITPGTTAVSIVQFGAGASYTAGAGLTLTGNAFAVGAGTGIVVSAGVTAIDTAVVGRKFVGTITGDGSTTAFTVTHNLANADAVPGFNDRTTGDMFFPVIGSRTANALVATINPPPAAGKVYGFTVVG